MPGTPKCAWCGAHDTIAGFTLVQCLACGLHTTVEGEKAAPTSQANEGVTVDDIAAPAPATPETPVEVVPDAPSTPDQAAADAAPATEGV